MRQRLISNVIWKIAERMLAQIVSLVVSVVLARLLAPDDYGALSMVIVFIAIANVFVTNGLPSALIQKKDADEMDFSSCFYLNLLLSIILYSIIFIAAPYIASFYGNSILQPVIRVLGCQVVIASVNGVQHSYVARNMMFKRYFLATLFGTVVSGVVGITMAYKGMGVWALVAQYMLNTAIDTIVLFFTVEWRPKPFFSLQRVRELFRFGWKILFESVSNTAAGQLQNLVIGKAYTTADLAFFTKGQHFPNLIVNNITSSIGAVLFPAFSNEQENKTKVLEMLRKSVRMSYYVVYPMLTGLAAVSTPFIKLLMTEKWLETVPYLQIFCLLHAPAVAMIPRHQALNGTGRSDIFMKEHIFARAVAIAILFLTYRISIMAILLGSILSTIILTIVVAYTSKQYNEYGYKDQIMDIMPTLCGCIVMGIPVYLLGNIGLASGTTLAMQVVAGIFVYYLYSRITDIAEYKICRQYVHSLLRPE
ncbi:MAG: lipopolysaccharide biosynthesis protein [Lachnospiraceae bacterium]|nr:lipopolysaccharide biosynthesis protein [Lachnospiraceae bacterium]